MFAFIKLPPVTNQLYGNSLILQWASLKLPRIEGRRPNSGNGKKSVNVTGSLLRYPNSASVPQFVSNLPFDFAEGIQYSGGRPFSHRFGRKVFLDQSHRCFPANSLRNQVKWAQCHQKSDTVL